METWVNSRSKTEDYIWRTCAKCSLQFPPTFITNGYDQWKFEDCVPWFGLVAEHDSAVLFFGNLMANKEDSRGRPIFVHAALQASSSQELRELYGITASLLVNEKELLPKWTAYFLKVFSEGIAEVFPSASQSFQISTTQESLGHFVYPREDLVSRERIARILVSSVDVKTPLAVGTTGRSGKGIFERVCNSQAKWQVAIFSSTCAKQTELTVVEAPLPGGAPNTRVIAAAIGGVILLSALLVAAGRSCRNTGEDGKADGGTNIVSSAIGGGESSTSPMPDRGRCEEPAGETRQGDSPTNGVTADVEKAAIVTNRNQRLN